MFESYNEVFKQHESLRETYNYLKSKEKDILGLLNTIVYEEVVFVACGSSYWLSTSACMTWQEKTGVRSCAVTSGDVVMNPEYYKKAWKKPLIIAPTRSGSTTETLEALKLLKEAYGCRLISFVEYENSPVIALSDLVLELPWANEVSVCQTRSFSNLYLAAVMLAAIAGGDSGLLNQLDHYISDAPVHMEKAEGLLNQIIKEFPQCKSLVTLGNGKQFGVSCEGAYICIEMAQFPSNYYTTLELRHGPIVMLDEFYLVVVFSSGSGRKLEEDMACESMEKKARVAVISDLDNFKNANYRFTLHEEAPPEVVALYGIYVMQGFAHLKAVDLGLDPDNPKELVPWIRI